MARLLLDGSKILALRRAQELTQQSAAEGASLTTARLRMLESGAESVRLTTLGRLAVLYEVDPCDVLMWEAE